MLDLPERELVFELLVAQVGPNDAPRAALAVPFIGTTFPAQLRQGNPRELVLDALRLCIANGWNGSPPDSPWLVRLITAFGLQILDPRIQPILDRLENPPLPPLVDPRDLRLLNNSTPFVNRAPLRLKLRDLESQAARAKPILVLNGPTKIGKSYSANYIEHYSNVRPQIITHRFEFDDDFGLELAPDIVARELVSSMGHSLATIPPSHTNVRLYARQLASWVLNEAATMVPSQNWFILDNFKGDKLRADTREFLIALSDKITTGVYRDHCRLILISFDRAQLTVDPGRVDEESIQPCAATEIDDAIEEILKHAPLAITAQQVAPTLLAGLPVNQSRMAELNIRLRGLLFAIQEIGAILVSNPTAVADFRLILLTMLIALPPSVDYLPTLQQRLANLRSVA